MSKKQDRQGARTPADLERKYDFDKSFSEIKGVANDARLYAEEAKKVATQVSETSDGITLKVQSLDEDLNGEGGVKAQLDLKVETDADGNLTSKVHVSGNLFTIETENCTLNADGTIRLKNGEFEGKVTSDEVEITGGKFALKMKNGSIVKMGTDVDILSIDSSDYDGSTMGTQVGLTPVGIQYVSGGGGVGGLPIQFNWSATEGLYHKLVGSWYIDKQGSSTPISSDENKKHDIQSQPEIYSRIFDRLRPVIFRYNNGTSDRLHTGFIAQDIENAVLAEGMETKDFAAICYDVDENGNKTNYGVRYEELVSMCIKEIQLLKDRIAELEKEE